MIRVAEALESLARVLEAPKKKKSKAKQATGAVLLVAAFARVNPAGKPVQPVVVEPGDELYIRRPEQPGAGLVTRDPAGSLYAAARQTLAAGRTAEILIAPYQKRWQTDADPCPVCDENSLVGWIDMDDEFPSGAMEPEQHPNCKCELIVRRIGG